MWRVDSNAEWVLTNLLDKLADKMRGGEEGSEHSPNNRQGNTCIQVDMGERPQSPFQDGIAPESREQSRSSLYAEYASCVGPCLVSFLNLASGYENMNDNLL